MAQNGLDESKIKAYLDARYIVCYHGDNVAMKIGEYSSAMRRLQSDIGYYNGALITAYNPHGSIASASTNRAHNLQLQRMIRRIAPIVIDAYGSDPLNIWPPEASYFAFGMSKYAAQAIGRLFCQDAFVWVGLDSRPELVLLR